MRNTKSKTLKPQRKAEPSKKECLCGCGGTPKGRFLPGHDAKLKGRLKREALGDDKDLASEAVKRLASLGWSWVLDTTPEQKAARQAELATRKVEQEEARQARAAQETLSTSIPKHALSGLSLFNTQRAREILLERPMSALAIAARYRSDFAELQETHGKYEVPFQDAMLLSQDYMVRHLRATKAA